jgi:hypothetical protein
MTARPCDLPFAAVTGASSAMPLPQNPPASGADPLSFSLPPLRVESVLLLAAYLAIGGVLALYIRFLYRRTSSNLAADSIARVFPLLTMVTIAVIAVVKSSLALSLGLVGALSIVRFRAAIKDPEELVYLFLCIGVGLALGAEEPWLAFVLVAVATVLVFVIDRRHAGGRRGDAWLTVVGPANTWFVAGGPSALDAVRALHPTLTVQRCEVDGQEGQLRVQLHRLQNSDADRLVASLRQKLPDCHIAFVDGSVFV